MKEVTSKGVASFFCGNDYVFFAYSENSYLYLPFIY
jgi:hypothetical protein